VLGGSSDVLTRFPRMFHKTLSFCIENSPMPSTVFLRAVNVGRHQRFRPRDLAASLARFEVRSLGAAGTFVVKAAAPESELRAAIVAELPFEPQMAVVPGEAVLRLLEEDPFADEAAALGAKRFVSVLLDSPASIPGLPLDRPEGSDWQVRLAMVESWFALSLRRRAPKGVSYANLVVEPALGVAATTRGWATMVSVARALS